MPKHLTALAVPAHHAPHAAQSGNLPYTIGAVVFAAVLLVVLAVSVTRTVADRRRPRPYEADTAAWGPIE